jgi:hypothetical protein
MKPATAKAIDERYQLEFMPFWQLPPRNSEASYLVRRMLHYHILRVQIEDVSRHSEGR